MSGDPKVGHEETVGEKRKWSELIDYFKNLVGSVLLASGAVSLTIYLLKIDSETGWQLYLKYGGIAALFFGLLMVIPFNLIKYYIIDPEEWKPNASVASLVRKLRLRAILFNNLSVVIFALSAVIVIGGFFFVAKTSNQPDPKFGIETTKISSTVLSIFLVQIFFRVFKYLLRVAAFYNGKADALEYNEIQDRLKKDPKIGLEKISDFFVPTSYDISDIPSPSLFDNFKKPGKPADGKES